MIIEIDCVSLQGVGKRPLNTILLWVVETMSEPGQIPIWQGTVLVVDDDKAVRRVAHDILVRTGMQILQAVNGAQGVELFQQHHQALGRYPRPPYACHGWPRRL